MTYNSVIEMAENLTLRTKFVAAAAGEGQADPEVWAIGHRWELASSPGWAASWDSAKAGMTINQNPNLGERDDVITDAMILAAVQALIAAEAPA